jgi:hypothetical protein
MEGFFYYQKDHRELLTASMAYLCQQSLPRHSYLATRGGFYTVQNICLGFFLYAN